MRAKSSVHSEGPHIKPQTSVIASEQLALIHVKALCELWHDSGLCGHGCLKLW